MRTTLTLDDDVAAMLEQVRKKQKISLKAAINTALRQGLVSMNKPAKRGRFRTEEVDAGRCYLPNLDDIAEVLAWAEGEDYR
jgi:hypothetical protein